MTEHGRYPTSEVAAADPRATVPVGHGNRGRFTGSSGSALEKAGRTTPASATTPRPGYRKVLDWSGRYTAV